MTFGAGRFAKVPDIVATMGGGPVLVVADAMLAQLGVTDQLANNLSAKGIACEMAAVIAGEPKEALVDELCTRARETGCKTVIGLGGGAAMDASKVVAAIATGDKPASAYVLAATPLPENGLPAIAIPTTAGTGSEVTRTAIISDKEGMKNWFWGEELMFDRAVLDPELTLSVPSHITAWTGIDAVAHALEGSTSRRTSRAGHLFGLEALRILKEALPKAVADGSDIEVRSDVLWAATVAGLALHNCNTHMGHNLSHGLGSLARIHHGRATGLGLEVSLPWLVERPEGGDNYARAAEALGGAANAEALPDAFQKLMRACGIQPELPQECAGVTVEALAVEMKNPANIGMAQNAACTIDDDGLNEMAARMMSLPLERATA
ncbi:MAG: iron-containing alcohol dehydrogenase [Pseudomonadota bacterium]